MHNPQSQCAQSTKTAFAGAINFAALAWWRRWQPYQTQFSKAESRLVQKRSMSSLTQAQNQEADITTMSALRFIISLCTWITHRLNIERQERGGHWYDDPSASRGL
jgi:hypothetical protein